MDALDIFTFIVMIVLLAVTIYLFVLIGAMPGKIAEEGGHPQTDAIRVTGWIGAITLGLFWPVAFIWAHTRPRAMGLNVGGEAKTQIQGSTTPDPVSLSKK